MNFSYGKYPFAIDVDFDESSRAVSISADHPGEMALELEDIVKLHDALGLLLKETTDVEVWNSWDDE